MQDKVDFGSDHREQIATYDDETLDTKYIGRKAFQGFI